MNIILIGVAFCYEYVADYRKALECGRLTRYLTLNYEMDYYEMKDVSRIVYSTMTEKVFMFINASMNT